MPGKVDAILGVRVLRRFVESGHPHATGVAKYSQVFGRTMSTAATPNRLLIESKFIGNFPLAWTPSPSLAHAGPRHHRQATQSTPTITTREELRTRFVDALQERIDTEIDISNRKPTTPLGKDEKSLLALLAIAKDPLTPLPFLDFGLHEPRESLQDFILDQVMTRPKLVESCTDMWTKAKHRPVLEGRSTADKTAQTNVRGWYQNRCPLTGVGAAQGVHIVDVRAAKSMKNPVELWNMLQKFWYLEDVKTFEIMGQENQNILPLQPTVHYLWDRNKFGLRPVKHPTAPKTNIYLQVNWFRQRHKDIEDEMKSHSPTAPRQLVTDLVGVRREAKGPTGTPGGECLQHGDVYMLYTSDPAARPLPNIRFLQMRYAVQQFFAGQQAVEALRIMFAGEAPNEDRQGPLPDEAFMPADWENMIIDACELGILDAEKEETWRRHILRLTYDQHLSELGVAGSESEGEEDY